MSKIAPRSNTNTRRKRLKKQLFIVGAGALFLVLVIATIVIAVKNSKDPKDSIKEAAASVDPYYFVESTPTPSLAPEPAPTFEATQQAAWIITSDFGSSVKMRTQPSISGVEVDIVRDREEVSIVGKTTVQDDGHIWYQIVYNNNKGFIRGDFLSLEKPARLPDILFGIEIEDVVTGKKAYSRLDYVSHAAPGVKTDITLATKDNFVGVKMYSKDVALIQKSTGYKLNEAAKIFAKDGYQLVLWDAYRPYSVTQDLFEIVQDNYLTANPKKGSKHNRGAAVDVTLYIGGKMANMPTDKRVMDLSESARNSSMSKEQKALMNYLSDVMVKSGFETYIGEWWHFNDKDWEEYPLMDFPLDDF